MNIFRTRGIRGAESADEGRRSFIWKMGAGASAAVASAAALAAAAGSNAAAAGSTENLSQRVAMLEEEKVLRRLHQHFEQAMDAGLHEQVIGMFADDAEVVFNGGVFRGREQGVSRLYRERFPSGKSGLRMQAAPGFELTTAQQQDSVEVSVDLCTAKAEFPYSIQVGVPVETESSLAAMARLHGEGVRTWWEGGLYKVSYSKDVAIDSWKISRLEYATLSRADYRPGKRYALPIAVAPLSTGFPEDRQGPDALA